MKRYETIVAATSLVFCMTTQVHASGGSPADSDLLNELKRMIEQQQAQIDKQAAELAALKEQLAGNTEKIATDTKADKKALENSDKMVKSSFKKVNVGLYGHLNRAMLYVNNGDTSKWYPVDNNNAQSRLGIRALVDTENGWQVGGRLEYGIVSNSSAAVNSENTHATSGVFNLRWADISFKHDRYGKFSLGKGDTASNFIAQTDLSGTTVASYSRIDDMAGGSIWYDSTNDQLTDFKIQDIYADFDGLSREDRIRYDTPFLAGFSLAASGSSGDAFDGALRYNRQFGETKIAAAFGAADPGDLSKNTDSIIAGSISVLLPIGLNATFSSGYANLKDIERDNPVNWWTKLGYRTMFWDSGTTAFSIDYGETSDLRANDETGKTWAIAAVHDLTDWGTEFYLAYRGHSLDSRELDVDDIHTFWSGARVKF